MTSGRRGKVRRLKPVQNKASGSANRGEHPAATALANLQRSHQRLEHLYELTRLFATFETVEQTFDPVLAVVSKALPIRSAIVIEARTGRSRMIVWNSQGRTAEQKREAKQHAEAAYAYFVGADPTKDLGLTEQAGPTPLKLDRTFEQTLVRRFIVIPLVVAGRPPFGVLQMEGAVTLDKEDLTFVNTVANQLAIALDRERAWGTDITRREYAEQGQSDAEARSVVSEQGRILANSSSNESAALAEENAHLYAEAQKAVQVREQILAVVSHDLRSPLNTILLGAGLLSDREDGLEERRRRLPQLAGRIERAAQRMLRQIEDLLDFASIEAGRLAIKLDLEEPSELIDEALAIFESVAQGKGLRLSGVVQPGLPRISCDRDRILQVFANLVGNATNVTPAGGQITLRVEAHGHELWFVVADSGPGIRPEDVKHLFERYWRSGEAQYRGTGLGLAIARGIITAHGGRIWVESELGRGTTFFFAVPIAQAPAVRPLRGKSRTSDPAEPNVRILPSERAPPAGKTAAPARQEE